MVTKGFLASKSSSPESFLCFYRSDPCLVMLIVVQRLRPSTATPSGGCEGTRLPETDGGAGEGDSAHSGGEECAPDLANGERQGRVRDTPHRHKIHQRASPGARDQELLHHASSCP